MKLNVGDLVMTVHKTGDVPEGSLGIISHKEVPDCPVNVMDQELLGLGPWIYDVLLFESTSYGCTRRFFEGDLEVLYRGA